MWTTMRERGRFVLILAALAVLAMGFSQAAAATGVESPITPGSQWTFRLSGGGCEVDLFRADGTFTHGVRYRDAGTYRTSATTLEMVWSQGGDAGTSFHGTYRPARPAFLGGWHVYGDTISATVSRGAAC